MEPLRRHIVKHGRLGLPGMSQYIATKMGIIGLMRGLANDVATDGITANAVLPGLTNTLATAPQSEDQKRATSPSEWLLELSPTTHPEFVPMVFSSTNLA